MKRRTAIASTVLLLVTAGLGVSASGRHESVARFSARSVQLTSAARLAFPLVDIDITQWSTDQDHRQLARTVQEQGPMAFSHLLAGYPALGWIGVGDREFTIRYAWQTTDRDGGRRIYVASDEPIMLMSREFRKFADPEPMMFLELRVDALGNGLGKLSDAARLSVDESRNVIELRDFDGRALNLVMVHDELNVVD